MLKGFLLFLSLLTFTTALAQRSGVVVNMETGVPLRNARIYTNTGEEATSNYKGEYTIKRNFTSATIACDKFVPLTLNSREMTDTLKLLPRFNTLDEVIVWGHYRHMQFNAKQATRDAKDYVPSKGGFDFFRIFQRHKGLNKKEKKKHDEIIETY